MPHTGPVLIDTNVILESHRLGCWSALAGAYHLETVESCVQETQTGFQRRDPEVQINERALRKSLYRIHDPSITELAEVAIRGGAGLDRGERALWANALRREDTWILCGPDRASMRFGFEAKLRHRLVALETLLADISYRPNKALKRHFEKQWLDDVIAKLVLGIL
jgi:hypothetical protein